VARRVRTSTVTVSRWELGVQAPLPHYREQLCLLYGLSARELGLLPEAAPADDRAFPHVPPEQERARRDLLGQVERYWIGADLEQALGSLPSLALALAERPDAVDDPRSVSVPRREARRLPRDTGIADVYRRLGEQMLILGDPGAGKTTLLLQLARELLGDARRRAADPMPVVFHLASWTPERRPFARWLADELHHRYGVARWLARQWVEDEQVLPLLDGLDEVADRQRAACVDAINDFHRDHGQLPMVVCCRREWYEALGRKLALRGAVAIEPLSRNEVRRYLREGGDELAGVRALLDDDDQLQELLTTPLFLKIAAITYRDRPAAARVGGTLAERRRRVLGDYVDAMLARASPSSRVPGERTLAWLSWLARTMRAHDQSVFYIDWMQPSWLPNRAHRWLVTRGVAAGIGLLSGSIVGLNWGADWGYSLGPAMFALIGLATGLLVGVFLGLVANESRIVPAERLRWSWSALGRGMRRWLGIGLGVGAAGGLLFGLVLGVALQVRPDALSGPRSAGAPPPHPTAVTLPQSLATGVASGVVDGLGLGLLIALSFGLVTGLDPRFDVTRLVPGKSVEASGRNAFLGAMFGACSFGLGFALLFGLGTSVTGPLVHESARTLGLQAVYWPVASVNDIVVAMLVGGVVAGLRRGGAAYLRHRALLALLVRSGCAPRDYVAFLERAARLVLLERRGAGYEFMHRMLLEYFADL
jgi:eukaryotic-like serine/threonine-protein kinase